MNLKSELVIRNCQCITRIFIQFLVFTINVPIFLAYTSLFLIVIKLISEKYEKNISNKKYAKLRNYLSKIKELYKIVLQKGLFASIKEHLANPKGQVEVEFHLIGSNFL